ncbi:hypothetical protein D3Z50_06055 [Clostridiaceae bacterium]|nr:hypothetical protein [Clostridiaceae bacterium]
MNYECIPLLNISCNICRTAAKEKNAAKQRYLHAPFLNDGGFDFLSRRFLLPVVPNGKSVVLLTVTVKRR